MIDDISNELKEVESQLSDFLELILSSDSSVVLRISAFRTEDFVRFVLFNVVEEEGELRHYPIGELYAPSQIEEHSRTFEALLGVSEITLKSEEQECPVMPQLKPSPNSFLISASKKVH